MLCVMFCVNCILNQIKLCLTALIIFIDFKKACFCLGMQAQVWTETMRTVDDELHEMIFPRLLAVAERSWHEAFWEKTEDKVERIHQTDEEWATFSAALTTEFMRLDTMGIMYRLPPPGARLE